MGCLSLKDPEQKQAKREEKRKKRRFASGIRQRWLKNILSITAAIVILVGVAFSVANGFYTYTTMRSGLEAEAATTAAFLRNYLNLDYNECYASCVLLVQNYARRDRLELQFVGSQGEVLASSYGLFADVGTGVDKAKDWANKSESKEAEVEVKAEKKAEDVKEAVEEKAEAVKEAVEEKAEAVKEAVEEKVEEVKEKLEEKKAE